MKDSSVRRNHLLKLMKQEAESAAKFDISFFKMMEMDLDTEH